MLKTNKEYLSKVLSKVLYKVSQCIDYQNLYALEEDFNKIGMTVQTTSKQRMILCKLQGGRPISEHVIDDYIFIGSIDDSTKELSENTTQKISDFIRNKASHPDTVKNYARVWRNGLRMYENNISIVNEDISKLADDIPLILG